MTNTVKGEEILVHFELDSDNDTIEYINYKIYDRKD